MKKILPMYIAASALTALIFILLSGLGGMAYAAANSSIEEAGREMEDLEGGRADLKKKLAEIKAQKADVIKYIEKIDEELEILDGDIKELEKKIEDGSEEYERLMGELREIEKEQKNQYDTMKARIKYMYENGNQEYVELLLASESFSELMNRTEYILRITQYDNGLLEEYCEKEKEVLFKRNSVDEKLKELDKLKKDKEFNQGALIDLKEDKDNEIKSYQEQIGKTKEEIKEYNEKILKQEELLERLLEEERRRIREEQEKYSEDNDGDSGSRPELFIWPLTKRGVITSSFGYRDVPIEGATAYHNAIDIGVEEWTPILASADGKVVTSRYSNSAGNYIMIYHGGSTYTVYMHAARLVAEEGDIVHQGDVIAYVGSTGVSTGPHLHFGINVGNVYVNPLDYVKQP